MKDIKLDAVLKIAGVVFAAGMIYANIKSSGEETRMQIEALKAQMLLQDKVNEKRLDRIEDYLDAIRRNGL